MGKRNLKSLYSWAQSLALPSSSTNPTKKPKKEEREEEEEEEEEREEGHNHAPQPKQEHLESLNKDEEEEEKERDGNRGQSSYQFQDDYAIPSDTIVALKVMHAQFPNIDKVVIRPFVLRSQLYSSIPDRTAVDRELEALKQQHVVRLFKLSTGQDDFAIMFSEDYLHQVKDAKKLMQRNNQSNEVTVFDWFQSCVVSAHLDVDITHGHLVSLLSQAGVVTDKHVSLLINGGLLVRQLVDSRSYWFSIPNVGPLLKSLTQGRKELLSFLNRRRYKEMLMGLLEKKRLRLSQLDIRFHIRDLLGSGHLITLNTPAGPLVRVSKD